MFTLEILPPLLLVHGWSRLRFGGTACLVASCGTCALRA